MKFKISALAAAVLLLTVALLGTGWISYDVEAKDISDPFDLEAAPHFSDVTYALSKPTYSTGFDSLGDWKVSKGSPEITVDNSTLTINASTSDPVEVTLSEEDRSGINTTVRSYLETKIKAGNLTAQYTNITLENTDTGDKAWVSISSAVEYGFSAASGDSKGTLYSYPVEDTWYRVAFELTTTGVTFYLFSLAGEGIANYYTNSANLTVGEVSEAHISIEQGGEAVVDNLYVTGESNTARQSHPTSTKSTLVPDSAESVDLCDMDPTEATTDRSGSELANSVYGVDANRTQLLEEGDLNTSQMVDFFATTPELPQRFSGKYIAKGWSDFRADMESNLKAKIAYDEGVPSSNVYLIDYYIDYLQIKSGYDTDLMEQLQNRFWTSMQEAAESMGFTVKGGEVDTGGDWNFFAMDPSSISRSTRMGVFDGPTLDDYLNPPSLLDWGGGVVEGAGAAAEEFAARWWSNLAFGGDDHIDELLTNMEDMYSDYDSRVDQLWNYTTSNYEQLSGDYQAMLSWTTGQVGQLSKHYEDSVESIQKMNAQYFNWTQQQFSATNSMYRQMMNQSQQTQQYFADQVARQNEVITNITEDVTNALTFQNSMWADFLSGGKPLKDSPLTQSSWFGSDFFTYVVVIVVCIAIAALTILLFKFSMKGKGRSGRRKR